MSYSTRKVIKAVTKLGITPIKEYIVAKLKNARNGHGSCIVVTYTIVRDSFNVDRIEQGRSAHGLIAPFM